MQRLSDTVVPPYILAAVLALALPPLAHGATRYVADTGDDWPGCGAATTACRSITWAISLAVAGDTIIVGPGRYGDLNRNGVLGDIPGEETGSAGCGCVLSINKNVVVISSAGAAVTMIDARTVNVGTNVLLITNGGEFGRPGKGFTVTETAYTFLEYFAGTGIALDSANVSVRGNQVIFTRAERDDQMKSGGDGIVTVNDAPIRIEGNQVMYWLVGIRSRGAALVSKNQVIGNTGWGIYASDAAVVGNVVTSNLTGIFATDSASVTGNAAYGNGLAGISIATPFSGSVAKNNMFANGGCGLASGVTGLKATNNYWGAPTGPGAPPADAACDYAGGLITAPYAAMPFAVKLLKP